MDNSEVQSITQMNGQNFLYYKSNMQPSSQTLSEDTLNFENYAFRHDMASIYNYATKIDEKFTNQFGIPSSTTKTNHSNYSSKSQSNNPYMPSSYAEYDERKDDASKYVLYNSHTCSNTNLLSSQATTSKLESTLVLSNL